MKSEEFLHIKYTELFNSQFKKAPLTIKIAFKEARELFLENQDHPSLRNHALRDEYVGYRSIDVTDDWRALFKIRKSKLNTTITFHILGTHAQLYKKVSGSD